MTRRARIVIPDCPHHVTQRGNRREPIFFEAGDQEVYRDLLAEQAEKARVGIWAYCLMPNHVHLIAVPRDTRGLGRAIGKAHRAASRRRMNMPCRGCCNMYPVAVILMDPSNMSATTGIDAMFKES